jgi:hydroxyacylglutathione hydrolase
VGAGAKVQKSLNLPLRCHAGDIPVIEFMQQAQVGYGFPQTEKPQTTPDLVHGMKIPFAGKTIEVRHVPGHSPGQVMFIWEDRAIVGDCLFYDSIGRTDLPGGDFKQLEQSIKDHIYTLPDDTIVHCGHGPDTTVGREKIHNPFVQG